jgi:glycosyltransferase involved in cell wall biosynthesis
MMSHRIIKNLQSKGHNVRVLLHQANHYKITTTYTYDGVDVFPPNANVIENLFRWSHCVFTHLDYTRWTIGMGSMMKKPVFHLIHNTHLYPEIQNANISQHIVYNSLWAKQKLGYKWSNFILTPPTDYRDFELGVDSADNEYITLINLNENKGGEIFYQIAKAMPYKKFLGVKGSYDEQIIKDLPNITYIDKTTNILSVYQKTRILLMPSKYESWGITATEAMCCGIPVISTEAEGLKENCAKAGIFIKDRNDIESWVKEITKLDDAKAYAAASKKAKGRAREHDPRKALDEFEQWLREEVNKYNG